MLGWSGRHLELSFPGAVFLLGILIKPREGTMVRKSWILIGIAVAVCFLAAATLSHAFDEKQFQTLKKTNKCKNCDLSGAKLNGLDLTYADLSGANLSGADLTNAIMQGANLSGANLSGANCTGANFNEATLKGANIANANFKNAYFDQARWTSGKMCAVGSIGQCK
jgi:uncharacterized protein YjbI with pentapeptide repeats